MGLQIEGKAGSHPETELETGTQAEISLPETVALVLLQKDAVLRTKQQGKGK